MCHGVSYVWNFFFVPLFGREPKYAASSLCPSYYNIVRSSRCTYEDVASEYHMVKELSVTICLHSFGF